MQSANIKAFNDNWQDVLPVGYYTLNVLPVVYLKWMEIALGIEWFL